MSARTRIRTPAALAVLASATLAACNPFSEFAPTHEEVRAQGWVFPSPERSPLLEIPERGFCYRTLARIDCYQEPVPGLDNRLAADPQILTVPAPYRR